MSKKKEELAIQEKIQSEISRVRMPRGNQTIGIVDQRLGGSRMRVRCFDGKTRICRIPGKIKRRLWVREGDYLLIQPWELGGDEKGDVVFKYRPTQVNYLKKKGLIKEMEALEDF
jgi:translation initiation factor 1A